MKHVRIAAVTIFLLLLGAMSARAVDPPAAPEAPAASTATYDPTATQTVDAKIPAASLPSDSDVLIKAIDIAGNFEVSDETILGSIQSKVGEPIDTKKLEADLERIYELGFFSEDVRVSLGEFDGGAKITLRVVENPVINGVNISGNSKITTTEILGVMRTKEKQILNSKTLREDVAAIDELYKKRGMAAAHVLDIGMDPKTNSLALLIGEGIVQEIKIVYITKEEEKPDEMKESDKGKTKPIVITREMKVKAGDTFNADLLQKDLQRVFNLGFFEDVRTKIDPGDKPGYIVLVIQVEEGKTGQLGFGAGYSSNSGLTGFLSYSERNLMGRGRRTDTKLEFGGKKNNYEISYFEPWLDNKRTSIEFSLYRTSTQNLRYGLGGVNMPDYEERRSGVGVTLGRPMSDYTRWFVGLKAENVQVRPLTSLNGNSRSVTFTLRTDSRDNIFFPSTGRYDSGSVELNGGLLGGSFTYQKYNLDIRRFHKVRKKLVAAGHFVIGDGEGGVPLFDRFDLGGVNTLRGYEENQFSGRKIAYTNLELRQNFSGNISGVVFLDMGNAWNRFEDVKFSPHSLYKSAGVGIRLKIPAFGMGPIRLDYAWSFTIGESQIHFGFGQMF